LATTVWGKSEVQGPPRYAARSTSQPAFGQELVHVSSAFGDVHGIINVHLDLDRSLLSGFIADAGWHPRFGVDYRIEIALSGFGTAAGHGLSKRLR